MNGAGDRGAGAGAAAGGVATGTPHVMPTRPVHIMATGPTRSRPSA